MIPLSRPDITRRSMGKFRRSACDSDLPQVFGPLGNSLNRCWQEVVGAGLQINVVLNWFEKLKQRVPGGR